MSTADFDRLLGLWMARERESRGISQEQLATQLGVGQPTMSKIEAGRRRVLVEELLHWAIVLGVESEALWARLDELRAQVGGDDPIRAVDRA